MVFNFRSLIVDETQLFEMVEQYFPARLRPGQLRGFNGVDLVDPETMREYLLQDNVPQDNPPTAVSINIAATINHIKDPTLSSKSPMWVIFIQHRMGWARTFLYLAIEVSRIAEAGDDMERLPPPDVRHVIRAAEICREAFPLTYINLLQAVPSGTV